jgi:hypothetical protein
MFGNPVCGWKKIITQYLFNSAFVISTVLLINGCVKDPDKIGRDLLPASDNIIVKTDSTTFISSYTFSGKPIYTSDNSLNTQLYAMGSDRDSIFGFSTASILTRFHPSMLVTADSVRQVDSLILYLTSVDHYGDSLGLLTLRIFELDKQMYVDSSYYSDLNPDEYCDFSTEIAHASFAPRDTTIRVKITEPGIISKFENMPDSVFKDFADFKSNFFGFYFAVDPVAEKGGFTYLNMSSVDSRLTMYYNGANYGDTISNAYEMSFTSIAAKANLFTHDYSGFPVAGHIDSPDSKDSLIFIEGLGGLSGRISLPQLDEWKTKGLITINKAELIFPVDRIMYPALKDDSYPPKLIPPKLILYSLGSNNGYEFMYDYRIDQAGTYYDGNYNPKLKAYVFNIGLHLQSYIGGKIENSDLILVSRKSNSSANRVILKGASSVSAPIRLKVIYTELF